MSHNIKDPSPKHIIKHPKQKLKIILPGIGPIPPLRTSATVYLLFQNIFQLAYNTKFGEVFLICSFVVNGYTVLSVGNCVI